MLPGFRRGVVQRVADPDHGRRREHLRRELRRPRFGIGYAQAQDGICLLAETFLTVDGERSAFFGPEGTFKNESEGGLLFTNLNSDFYWTSIKDEHTVQKLLKLPYPQGPATEGLEAAKGYAAGYDAYLKQIGGASGVTNPACKGAAWVRPIKPIDVWLRIYQIDDLAGNSALGPAAEANPAYGPPADPSAESAKGQGGGRPRREHPDRAARADRAQQPDGLQRSRRRWRRTPPTEAASCSPTRTSRGMARNASGR